MAKPLKRVLVVTDLEGVTPVNDVAALCFGHRRYRNACRALTNELLAVVRGLAARGVREIVVSDSHRGGNPSSNIELERLPNLRVLAPGQLPEFSGGHGEPQIALAYWDDAFDERLMRGADALVALGMHPGAGVDAFASHTFDPHCLWMRGDQEIDELNVLLALAAELEIQLLLASGDSRILETLPQHLHANFVPTKTSQSKYVVHCCDASTICALLEHSTEAFQPVGLDRPQGLPLKLLFKSAWCESEKNAPVLRDFGVDGPGFVNCGLRGDYLNCLALVSQVSTISMTAFNRVHHQFGVDPIAMAREMLTREFPGRLQTNWSQVELQHQLQLELQQRCEKTWVAFDALTDGGRDYAIALKALVLVIVRAWAPPTFERLALSSQLEAQLELLRGLSQSYPPELNGATAMARMDAHYLLWLVDNSGEQASQINLEPLLSRLRANGQNVYAWVIESLYHRTQGLPLPVFECSTSESDRWSFLYILTHHVFFKTDYLLRPMTLDTDGKVLVEQFFHLVPTLLQEQCWDVAAEVVLCLLFFGEGRSAPTKALIQALVAAQLPDGSLRDYSMVDVYGDSADHASGLLFLVLAKLESFQV